MSSFAERAEEVIHCDCRMISGCEDAQTSADVGNVGQFELPDPHGRAGGACTSALLNVLYKDESNTATDLSFVEVLRKMRTDLRSSSFTQNPQLSSSRQINLNLPFHIVNPEANINNTRRAVLIGINYVGQNGQLSGCHNDAMNIYKYLVKCHGFSESNITVLLDDGKHMNPTRQNIMNCLEALVDASQPGDSVFVHYSGHGGSLADDNGDEDDGKDETLIPVDFKKNGQIRDDELFEKFIVPMQTGVTVTCLMDCCHSGSILDLPYTFTADGSSSSSSSNPQMQQNPAFKYAKLASIAIKVLPIAMKAWQRAQKSSDPMTGCFTFWSTMAPVISNVMRSWN